MLRSFAAGGRCVCGGCRRQDQQHLLLRAQLDAVAQAAVGQDSRFGADGELLVFTGEIDPALEDELDHRRDRDLRLDELVRGIP